MAKLSLEEALNNVEITYQEIIPIANDMISDLVEPINIMVDSINQSINNLSNEEIRSYILRLQLRAYQLSEPKEKSVLKATLSEALKKETYANAYQEASGTNGAKDNIAWLACSEQIVIEALYELVSSLLKTKLDQVHRLVDALKSILLSRMQEAKLTMNAIE